jgi:hypothetical protein
MVGAPDAVVALFGLGWLMCFGHGGWGRPAAYLLPYVTTTVVWPELAPTITFSGR